MRIHTYIRLDIDSGEVLEEHGYEYDGPLELCGGGPSGTIAWPDYLQDVHRDMIGDDNDYAGTSLGNILETMIAAASPFSGVSAYDPTTPLADMQTRHDTLDTAVAALDPSTDYDTHFDNARTKVDEASSFPQFAVSDLDTIHAGDIARATAEIAAALAAAVTLLSDSSISDTVDEYENKIKPRYMRAISRLAAGMADINAVNSSAFPMAIGMVESEMLHDINDFEAKLKLSTYNKGFDAHVNSTSALLVQHIRAYLQRQGTRDMALASGNVEMTKMLMSQIDAEKATTALQVEVNRMEIVASKEQTDRDIEIDVLDALWDVRVMQEAGEVLGALNGAPLVPKGPSQAQSVIGGALSGVAMGAAVTGGSPIGAGIGGLLGAGASLL